MGARLLAAVSMVLALPPAHAQRREGTRTTKVLEVRLPASVKLGELTFPARTYRVTLTPDGFALADPETMILIATVPVTETTTEAAVAHPSVEVKQSGRRVDIIMRAGDRILRATGVTTEPTAAPEGSRVILAGKTERAVTGGGPETLTGAQLVGRATKRYMSGIKHCADTAHRSRWGTDDHRFINCVCPIVLRWKMPPLQAPLLMHWPLARGRHGFSYHVTKTGKVISCRVWAGARPPAQPVIDLPAEPRAPAPNPDAPPAEPNPGVEPGAAPGASVEPSEAAEGEKNTP